MPDRSGRLWLGVCLVLVATLLFAAGDTTGKHLALTYAVPLILLVRSVVTMAILGAALYPSQRRATWATNRTGVVILRSLCLVAASFSMIEALRLMPLGETVAIIYLAPFLVMILARPLLGEQVPATGWIGAVVAFGGVLLIVRPGSGLDPLGVVLALLNACLSTGYHLLTRVLTRTESTVALTFNTASVGFVVYAVMLAVAPPALWPDAAGLGLMALLGALATGGHFLFAAAYRHAGASVLAPVNYMHVVWAAGLGWLVFSHRPDGLTALGMALVVAGGAAVALRAGIRRPA